MTIKLSPERHAQAVRQALDATFVELRRIAALPGTSRALSAALDKIADDLCDATVSPDATVPRSGMYNHH